MSEPFDPERHAIAMAEVMRLEIRSEWMPTVVANVKITAAAAELLLSFPLDDHVEPAPVFTP